MMHGNRGRFLNASRDKTIPIFYYKDALFDTFSNLDSRPEQKHREYGCPQLPNDLCSSLGRNGQKDGGCRYYAPIYGVRALCVVHTVLTLEKRHFSVEMPSPPAVDLQRYYNFHRRDGSPPSPNCCPPLSPQQ